MTLSIVAERMAANLWFPVRILFTKTILCDIVNNNAEKRREIDEKIFFLNSCLCDGCFVSISLVKLSNKGRY